MRVILTAFGTAGDVSPLISLALALRAQGDDPVVVTNPYYGPRLAREGLQARLCGPRLDPVEVVQNPRYTHKYMGPIHSWDDLFLPQVHHIYRATRELLEQSPTAAVVNHPWCFGGFLAAEEAGVPAVMVALAPLVWYSAQDPSLYGVARPPAWMHGWLVGGPVRWLLQGLFGRSLRQACRELGLPDHKPLFFGAMERSALNLALWSPYWRGPASDDPPHAHLCGFPVEEGFALDPALEDFLAQGEPPVVLGLGSALPRSASDIAQALSQSCRELGLRLVLVGTDPEALPQLPPGQIIVPWAPYAALFPRAQVVVHHAGIGTQAEALRCGQPSIAIPFGNDQPDNAWRSQRLQGSAVLKREGISAAQLTQALRRCLEDPAQRREAAKTRQHLLAEPKGAQEAARILKAHFS